jgi:hypothetical protein
MSKKTIVISRSYDRVDQFRAAHKNGKRITDIHACEIDGFSLFHNEYPAAVIKHTVIKGPGEDGLKQETIYLKCRSIEFTMAFEEITKERYDMNKREARHDND